MPRYAWLLWILFLACSAPMSDSAPTSRPNLALPTLGGKQLWADCRWQAHWRIQQNVITEHYRLLDERDRRRAWGNYNACKEAMEKLAPAPPADPSSLVILLHGMGRSRKAFAKMQQQLEARGWTVASLSYPSTRRSIQAHAQQLADLLVHLKGYTTVHFVTHSLGGIVLRQLLAEDAAWRSKIQLGRVVMLAPPNQGSAFAAKLESFPPFRWLFGETGQSLTPQAVATLPAPKVPFLIIAGARGTANGWNPMLPGDDDFVVRVAETHMRGEAAHMQVASLHTFLMNQDSAIAATADFLQTGLLQ